MGRIVSLLSRLDARIQRRFDSMCFFLMSRFGVRKSTLRFWLMSCKSLGRWGTAVAYTISHRYHVLTTIAMAILILSALGAILTLQDDHQTEQTENSLSRTDKLVSTVEPWRKFILFLVGLGGLAYTIRYCHGVMALICGGGSIAVLIEVLLVYLAKTPMNPPAEKAREHVGTPQTAPAET